MWLDIPRPHYGDLSGSLTATCWSSAAATPGCGRHCMPHSAIRTSESCSIDAERVGWAASGRNGGFVDASLTHGVANGKSRWPNEIDEARRRWGCENLDGMQADIETARARRRLAAQRHADGGDRTPSGGVARRKPPSDGEGPVPRRRPRFVARSPRRPIWRACSAPTPARSSIPPSWRSNSPAPAHEAGVHIYEHTNATSMDSARRGGCASRHGSGVITARPAVLATNVFTEPARRNRLHTVPVYDYVLATEPLTDAQLDRIGWHERQGIGDCANQFHYYRLTADNRIVWGGYDAIYHFGRRVEAGLRGPARDLSPTRRALLHHLPAARRRSVQPSVGRRHRHQHAVLRALGPGQRRPGRLRQRIHRPRRRRGPVRCRRLPRPARRRARPNAPSWRWCANGRCRSHLSRWPASESRPRDGRSIAPTTSAGRRNAVADARWTHWASASIPDRLRNVCKPFGLGRSEPHTRLPQSVSSPVGYGEIRRLVDDDRTSPSERGNDVRDRLHQR